jgi:ribosomal protein L18E
LRNDSAGKKHKIPVNISNIEKGLEVDPPIGDGDIVVVPEKVFGF